MQGQSSERKQNQRTKKEGEKQVKFTSIDLHVEELTQSRNHKEEEMKLSVNHMSDISNAITQIWACQCTPFCRCLWWAPPWPLASPALSAQHFTIKPLKMMVATRLLSLNTLPLHIHKIIYFFSASNISHPGGSRLLADQSFKVTMLFVVEYLISNHLTRSHCRYLHI